MKRKLKYDNCSDEVASKKPCLDSNGEVNGNDHDLSKDSPNDISKDTSNDLSKFQCQLDYDPVHFIRCHSRNNDVADVQTQVWQCAFEPDPYRPPRTTDIVATCGGNSVCFINVKKGDVVGKYYAQDKKEMFLSLAWTTLRNSWATEGVRANILAVGGAKTTIHLIHPANSVAFLKMTLKTGCKAVINSLLFHPEQPNILFCGTDVGDVVVLDIGMPLPPDYSPQLTQLHILSYKSEIITMAFCGDSEMLLVACSSGLVGWRVSGKELRKAKTANEKFELVEFNLPKGKNSVVDTVQLVDSVQVLENGLVATKTALSGVICIWNLMETLQRHDRMVKPIYTLEWSDTDNYFMYMGYHPSAGLLACGDDKGALWLYDIHALLQRKDPPEEKDNDRVLPTTVLGWPNLTDTYIDRKRKLSLDVYDILVDKVVVNHEGSYLVAVTSNNMVCIWERTTPPL